MNNFRQENKIGRKIRFAGYWTPGIGLVLAFILVIALKQNVEGVMSTSREPHPLRWTYAGIVTVFSFVISIIFIGIAEIIQLLDNIDYYTRKHHEK